MDGPRRTAETILERLARDDRSGAFFSKIEEQRGGLDLRVGSKEIARILARELADRWGAETNESASLVGRSRTGQDLVRTTFLLRLPPYGLGDFVETEEGLFKIEGIQRRRLLLFDLAHRRTIGRDPHRIEALKVIGRTTDELDAVVVSHTGSRLQLLDPITLATVDLEAPPDIEIGSSVRVFRHDERLWIVGPPPQAKA